MKNLALTAVIALCLAGTARADEKDDLANAAKKSTELKSFAFKGETKMELPAMMGGAMGEADPTKFEGKFENGVGSWLKTDTHEFVTVGKNTVTRPIAEWKKVEEDEDDPMAMQKKMMQQMFGGSKPIKAPVSDLTDLGKKLAKAKKQEKKELVGETDCDVFTGEYTESAAEDLVKDVIPVGGAMRMAQADVTYTGSIKAWVDGDGRVVKYEIKASMSTSLQGMDLEWGATKTVSVSGIDSTKVELSDEVKKALEK
jgi:hypothetical protein